jgi:arylsulfatase A-like enzyme
MFEGGIRVPCAVKWPGKISPATVSQQPCMTFDFSASIIRVAGASIPENRAFDGIDILKLIEENQTVVDRTLYWRARRGMQTRKAVRQGDLKYIWLSDEGKVDEYLFNLGNDLAEKTNLFDSLPDIADHLKTLLYAWEDEVKPRR